MSTAAEPEAARTERHASWTELFFDLVAVAGVSALAHVLRSELDAAALGLYALLFLAFWLSWTTFMLYSNVAADQTRVVRLLTGMFGLGVMAASVPGVAHTVLGDGGSVRPMNVFAIAYIATRIYGSQSWRRGEVLSVVFGYAGLPHLRAGRIPTRAALGLHCLVTGVVATVAVPLSLAVRHGSDPLPGQGRWLLCGAVAAYFALGVVTGVASHSSDLQRTISRVITGIAVPLLLGLLATGVRSRTLVACLALVVLAHLWFERRLTPGQDADQRGGPVH